MKTMSQTTPTGSLNEPLAARMLALVLKDNAALPLENVALRLLIAPHLNARWPIAMATAMAGK